MNDLFKILNELSFTCWNINNIFENDYKWLIYQNGIRINKKRRSKFFLYNVV